MIVAKAILNVNAITIQDLDGNNILSFSYEVKDNYDTVTEEFDSHYLYSNFIPIKDISLNLIINLNGETESFEINYGKNQISFTAGEYYTIVGAATLDPGDIYSLISITIYAS